MNKSELKNFNIDEYKQEVSIYKSYTEKLNDLEKLKESLKPPFPFVYGFTVFISFLIFSFCTEDFRGDFLKILFTSFSFSFLFHEVFYADFFINIKSFGELNDLKRQIVKIEELRNDSYKKLQSFEKIIRDYFQIELKDFFNKNLYKKRSGSKIFEDSLSEFSSMIDEAKTVSLVTTRINLSEHEYYLLRRKVDHNFQTSKKTEKLDSISIITRNISKMSIQKPREFFAPERLYRTARKIDNWEEINKKRKMIGLKGEEITVVIEQTFLESIGRKDLAQKVRHVSLEDGDGLGYDILSFFENGKEKYIEVKTTTVSLSSSFYLSKNELAFLKEHNENAFIYRILISIDGPQIKIDSSQEFLDRNDLIPIQYMVKEKQDSI